MNDQVKTVARFLADKIIEKFSVELNSQDEILEDGDYVQDILSDDLGQEIRQLDPSIWVAAWALVDQEFPQGDKVDQENPLEGEP